MKNLEIINIYPHYAWPYTFMLQQVLIVIMLKIMTTIQNITISNVIKISIQNFVK